jgi:outer membrane protein assembly factor BamC
MMRLALAVLLVCLAGCSWFGTGDYIRDRSNDYRKAKTEPPLKVPPGLEDDALQSTHVIPPITERIAPSGEFEVPRPAPLVGSESEEMVRIQRLGEEEWMLASVAPGQLWPQVRAFLTSSGLQVARVDARAGLMETGWYLGQGASMNERYRFRIEQGVQRNTAELHVLQQFQTGDINSWPATSSDIERESDMLMAVAQFIANTAEAAPVSMMAQQSMGEGGRVSLQEDSDGTPFVRLKLPYYRAWASVDRALRESSFRVRDLDRSRGVFYVRFVPPEEDSGWFDWLLGDDEDAEEAASQDYLLTVKEESENEVRIDLAREDGAALDRAQAQQLLSLLKGNIN